MELKGSRTIAAERHVVWAALNDADVLKAAIPGCTELTGDPASGFEAKFSSRHTASSGALVILFSTKTQAGIGASVRLWLERLWQGSCSPRSLVSQRHRLTRSSPPIAVRLRPGW